MVPDHGTQYEGNPYSHHGGMLEDGLTDGRMDRQMYGQLDGLTYWTPFPIFPKSA